MTNEEVVRRYIAAQVDHDYDTQAALRDPQWSAVWPQSGEVVRGWTEPFAAPTWRSRWVERADKAGPGGRALPSP